MSVLTYNPDSVSLIFGGYEVSGWNTLSIERNTEFVKQIRGIRGKNSKEVSMDTSCTILLRVPQATEVNTILSLILKNEEETKGKVRLEVGLKDSSGESVFSSLECYIGGWPKVEYSNSLSEVEWKFLCDSSEWRITGTEANRNSLIDMISGELGSVTGSFN